MASPGFHGPAHLGDAFHLSCDMIARVGARRLASLVLEELAGNEAFRAKVLQALQDQGAQKRVEFSDVQVDIGDEPHFVGDSPAMRQAFSQVRKFAVTDLPILVTGESGTGKELAALAIHERSAFSNGPFVAVNCSGLPGTLITSELFGYEKGAFTGASQRKIGRVEAAEGGTLFLDEIGDMPLELQGHLLRFLQDKTIDRVGSQKPIPVNVRVVAATNRNLEDAVQAGAFRLDLYYRLKVLHVHLPQLKDRGGDVVLLARYFVRKFAHELHSKIEGIDRAALNALKAYDWPGNVRELISVLRSAIVMAEGRVIQIHDLNLNSGDVRPEASPLPRQKRAPESLPEETTRKSKPLDAHLGWQRERLSNALVRNRYNVTRTARELGVSRVTLYRLMDKYELRSIS